MSFQNAKIFSTGLVPDGYFDIKIPRGDVKHSVSSSTLREFAPCPARWLAGYESPDSEAKRYGSLLDCLALTPEQFQQRFAVQPLTYENEDGETKPWNNNAKVCRGWVNEQAGKQIITDAELGEATDAVATLAKDEIIAAWFDACDRQVCVTGEWHDERTSYTIPVRCLIDFVPRLDTEFAKCLGDLKTTRNAALMPWQRWCFSAGFHIQAAFNLDLFTAATEQDRVTWCFILQENYLPFQPGKRMLSADFLTLGRAEYRRLLANYCWCLKTGQWPGYDDSDESIQGWSLVHPEPWMAERAAFAPKYDAPPEGEPTEDNADVPS